LVLENIRIADTGLPLNHFGRAILMDRDEIIQGKKQS
jgi:hypothetical protein